MGKLKHPSGINQAIVDKVVGRRGKLHAYESIDPAKTALVVVDLDEGSVDRIRDHADTTTMAANIRRVAASLRQAGGSVAWVTTPVQRYNENVRALLGEKATRVFEEATRSGAAQTVYAALEPHISDIYAAKQDYSAFFPGKSDLHEQLQARDIDTIIIAGTVTNVCCESSARDAYELGYRVIMLSDALFGHAHGLHEGTLAVIFRNFGDVRTTPEIVALLEA